MVAVSPPLFLADPQVRPFARDSRADLAAPDILQVSNQEFVIYSNKTKKGQVEVIKSNSPYAVRRTDVNTPQESFEMIPPEEGNGWVSFTPQINGQCPIVLDIDYNAPRNLPGPLSNLDRIKRAGISSLSPRPWEAAQYQQHPLFSFIVPSKAELIVTFSLLPPAVVNPIANPFTIGGLGQKRVDFAGVVIAGVQMPQHLYDSLLKTTERSNLV